MVPQPCREAPGSAGSLTASRGRDLAAARGVSVKCWELPPRRARSVTDFGAALLTHPTGVWGHRGQWGDRRSAKLCCGAGECSSSSGQPSASSKATTHRPLLARSPRHAWGAVPGGGITCAVCIYLWHIVGLPNNEHPSPKEAEAQLTQPTLLPTPPLRRTDQFAVGRHAEGQGPGPAPLEAASIMAATPIMAATQRRARWRRKWAGRCGTGRWRRPRPRGRPGPARSRSRSSSLATPLRSSASASSASWGTRWGDGKRARFVLWAAKGRVLSSCPTLGVEGRGALRGMGRPGPSGLRCLPLALRFPGVAGKSRPLGSDEAFWPLSWGGAFWFLLSARSLSVEMCLQPCSFWGLSCGGRGCGRASAGLC